MGNMHYNNEIHVIYIVWGIRYTEILLHKLKVAEVFFDSTFFAFSLLGLTFRVSFPTEVINLH